MNDFPTEHGDFHGFRRFPSRFFHRDSPAFDVKLLIFMCVGVKIPPISSSIPLFWGSIHFCCSFHQYMEGKKHVFAEKKIQKNHQLKTYFLLVFPHFFGENPHFSPWNSSISTAARCTQHLLLALRRLPATPTSQGRLPPGG